MARVPEAQKKWHVDQISMAHQILKFNKMLILKKIYYALKPLYEKF